MINGQKTKYILFVYLLVWFAVNVLFLTEFPFVHTDELWLSGLSRSMMEDKSPAATEDFFDLYERNPHAIKILFHSIQSGFIRILGYSLKTVRILSLVTSILSLLLMYKLTNKILTVPHKKNIAVIITIWMSLDVQYIYISHFARQEITLVLLLIIMLNLLVSTGIKPLLRGASAGALLGLAAGFHPNSFLIAWPVGLFLLVEILQKKRRISEGAAFITAAAAAASIFVIISFGFNPEFIHDYLSYGKPLGVLDSPDMKLLKLPGFYKKLFTRISGTYYTSEIRLQMIIFPLLLTAVLFRKKGIISLCGFLGFNIGLLIIGKYSQPSIIFLFPFYYLLWAEIMDFRQIRFAVPLFIIATLVITIGERGTETEKFSEYTEQLNNLIPPGSRALGNIYSEFAMSDGQYYDWRNLHFLKEKNISLTSYIDSRKIEYIILSEEISFIYENRPYWNVIYGNTAHWYPAMLEYINENCILIGEFESPGYGMRIVPYRYEKPWFVKIYKVSIME